MASPTEAFTRAKNTFDSGITRTMEWRQAQLQAVIRMCNENRANIIDAVATDLGRKVKAETNFAEVGATIVEAERSLQCLAEWTAPEFKDVPLFLRPATAYISKEPFGVVCILSPFNYPWRLTMLPLVGAIAAGNAVVVKPSELSPTVSALMKRLVEQYLDREAIHVVEGAVAETTELLQQPFNYFFYTGSTNVGKIVMRAAAEHLAPVTLELGGKSPCIVASDADIPVAARRIANGRFQNAGQVCVAPDHVLVARERKAELVAALTECVRSFFGPDPHASRDLARIINERHTRRLEGYLSEIAPEKIICGGDVDASDRYVAPTLVDEPPLDSAMMTEEIFGPILPIIAIDSVDQAIRFINDRPKPLALYVFSEDPDTIDKVVAQTSSGGVAANTTVVQIACPDMEFGGVGASGMGAYNGKHTFDTFTHRKAVLEKATWLDPKGAYPPFTPKKENALNSVADGFKVPTRVKAAAAIGALGAAFLLRSRL